MPQFIREGQEVLGERYCADFTIWRVGVVECEIRRGFEGDHLLRDTESDKTSSELPIPASV